MRRLVVVNCGTSSLKYATFAVPGEGQQVGAGDRRDSGVVETGPTTSGAPSADLRTALTGSGPASEDVLAVAHRVVHGADVYPSAVVVDDRVESEIDRLALLAPLHNPANLAGIRLARELFPGVTQVAVFDTAFHATIPAHASTYAIPQDLARAHRVRRWGFQGTSCASAVRAVSQHLGRPADRLSLVICHLGSGASVTAVQQGRSIDTSMGMTPLEGLVMGTRSGDLDPAAVTHLMRAAGLGPGEVLDLLTRRSGLLGLTGESDLRAVRRRATEGDETAELALAVSAHRLRKYIAAGLAQLPDLDALVFTGGVGEHDPVTRREAVQPLSHLGLSLDEARNRDAVGGAGVTAIDGGVGPAILVVPADEELEIARQAMTLLR